MQTVSIIIPCRNEEKHIELCLMSLLENGYPKDKLELLVIDGKSTDATHQIVNQLQKKFPQIKYIVNKKMKTPFALNLGVNEATGHYTLIASAHSSFDTGYIETLVNKMEELDADVVGGSMETKIKNQTATAIAIQKVLAHPIGVGNALFRTGVTQDTKVDTVPFGLYKTRLLKEVKGYDERLIRNHDIELSKRLLKRGTSIYLVPSAKCTYFARETWGALAKNNFDNGKWNMLTVYLTKDFSSLSLRHFIPLLFILSLVLPMFGMFIDPLIGFLGLFSITTYLLALIFVTTKIEKKQTSFIHLILTFIVLHFAYGLGSLVGAVQIDKLAK